MNCTEFNYFSQDKRCRIRVTIILGQRGLAEITQFMVRTVPRTPTHYHYSYVRLRLCFHMYSTSLLHFFTDEDSFNLLSDVNYSNQHSEASQNIKPRRNTEEWRYSSTCS
jgi:hypothetical protein